MNKHYLNTFFKRIGTNAPEALEILGLVLRARARVRIVDKSMLIMSMEYSVDMGY